MFYAVSQRVTIAGSSGSPIAVAVFFFLFLFQIEVCLTYNFALVSDVQHNDLIFLYIIKFSSEKNSVTMFGDRCYLDLVW